MRVVAIDWSGAKQGPARSIFAAVVEHGHVALEGGRDRGAVIAWLLELARQDPELVVGLDFAFSFPAWFVEEWTCDSAPAMWEVVRQHGEEWLRDCPFPFWGRPSRRRPDVQAHFRRCELEVQSAGHQAKSVFQIGGAGTVGTGSIRGMPYLAELRRAGFSVWPFDPPVLPMVIEIYPRTLTGPVVKSSGAARARWIRDRWPRLAEEVILHASSSEDAFDALASGLAMWDHREEIARLGQAQDEVTMLEGEIWCLPTGVRPEGERY